MWNPRRVLNALGLETNQVKHNSASANAANYSPSNNSAQASTDAVNMLLSGAEKAAAGRTLGLSEEETIAAVSREFRRQKRKDDTITPNDITRQIAQSAKSLSEVSESAEIQGVRYFDDKRDAAFGEDQSAFQMSTIADKDYSTGPRDDNTIAMREDPWNPSSDIISVSVDPNKPTPAGLVEEFKRRDFGLGRDVNTSSAAGVADALNRLESAVAAAGGYENVPVSASGARAIDISDRLEDSLRYNRDVERSSARDLIAAENARLRTPGGQEQAERNAWRAKAEADLLGMNFLLGGPGAFADEQIGRIREIRKLGSVKEPQTYQVINYSPPSTYPVARSSAALPEFFPYPTYVDPNTNTPLGQMGPSPVQSVNQPSSSQVLNAPNITNTTAWLSQNAPQLVGSNPQNIGHFPQRNISGITRDVARSAQSFGWDKPDVRSVGELQQIVDMVLAEKANRREKTYKLVKDPLRPYSEPDRVYTETPGVAEALSMMDRMKPEQQQALAAALFQIENASPTAKAQYVSGAGPRASTDNRIKLEALGDTASLARPSRSKTVVIGEELDRRGRKKEKRQEVEAALKALKSKFPGSQSSDISIGAIGTEPPILRQFGSRTPRYNTDAIGLREVREGDWYKKNQPMRKKVDGVLKERYDPAYQEERAKNLETTRSRQVSSATAESRFKEAEKRRQKEEAIMAPYRVTIGG